MRATTKEQGFYSQIFKLVLPIVIQNLLSAAVNSADVVMLNYVGQSAISAVSLASNYANVLFMVYYGLGTPIGDFTQFDSSERCRQHVVDRRRFILHKELPHQTAAGCKRGGLPEVHTVAASCVEIE